MGSECKMYFNIHGRLQNEEWGRSRVQDFIDDLCKIKNNLSINPAPQFSVIYLLLKLKSRSNFSISISLKQKRTEMHILAFAQSDIVRKRVYTQSNWLLRTWNKFLSAIPFHSGTTRILGIQDLGKRNVKLFPRKSKIQDTVGILGVVHTFV